MRRVSENVYAEIYFWGCNPGFVVTGEGVVMIDTPQQPIDAVRWRERLQEYGPIRYLINTEPHVDHILGNAYFPGVEPSERGGSGSENPSKNDLGAGKGSPGDSVSSARARTWGATRGAGWPSVAAGPWPFTIKLP